MDLLAARLRGAGKALALLTVSPSAAAALGATPITSDVGLLYAGEGHKMGRWAQRHLFLTEVAFLDARLR
jgi:hypothetical protein